jgi:hypothetical protein
MKHAERVAILENRAKLKITAIVYKTGWSGIAAIPG